MDHKHGFVYRIERLTKLAKGVAVVRQAPINPTDDWHDDAGKMLLVGDAIHYVFVSPIFFSVCTLY